jgi:hypothetical protein
MAGEPELMIDMSAIKQRREQLVQMCAALPEVNVSGEQHLTF